MMILIAQWVMSLLDILKYILPSLILLAALYFVMRHFYRRELIFRENRSGFVPAKITLPLRLQAYERLSLFCERIQLPNLLLRIREEGMTAKQLQLALQLSIQQEYEHNMAQQIYVSPALWQIVQLAKNDSINMLASMSEHVSSDATGTEFSKALFTELRKKPNASLDKALEAIKTEAQALLVSP